jgi:hypothetical protein
MSRKIDPQFAESQMLTAGLQPLEPYKNAISNWRCKCLNCNQIVISRYNRVQQGSGCPRCAAVKVGEKIRLSEEAAVAKLGEYNLEPIEPYVKSDVKWKCKCLSCGQIVYPKLKNLQRGDGGCYQCGMKKAGLKNTMSQVEASQIVTDAGFEPLEPYRNALAKWKIRHTICGSIFYPNLNNISQGSGCPTCANSGFDPNKDSHIYFLSHPDWQMYQVGITNFPEQRINSHKKLGWELIEIRGPMDGFITREWESSILRMLKAKGADLSNSKIGGKFDGYSEAWSKSTFDVKSIKELMRLTDEFERNLGNAGRDE